jgi:hypothetical protein
MSIIPKFHDLSRTELFLTGKAEEQIEWLRKLSPLERLAQPEDIANVVSFRTAGVERNNERARLDISTIPTWSKHPFQY